MGGARDFGGIVNHACSHYTRRDFAYSLVLVWALIGIVVNQRAYQNIVLAAAASVIIILVALVAVTAMPKLKK